LIRLKRQPAVETIQKGKRLWLHVVRQARIHALVVKGVLAGAGTTGGGCCFLKVLPLGCSSELVPSKPDSGAVAGVAFTVTDARYYSPHTVIVPLLPVEGDPLDRRQRPLAGGRWGDRTTGVTHRYRGAGCVSNHLRPLLYQSPSSAGNSVEFTVTARLVPGGAIGLCRVAGRATDQSSVAKIL